ncbi:hypothetical protein WA026_003579 [Henosepilachna vigintioctopunctata]|uniref:15-cis-phytoene synthase n=1 Tax=Henosepilachna vigintioctopunctata TaxID=420089 RepID=A0AAW1TQ22_9CUCU
MIFVSNCFRNIHFNLSRAYSTSSSSADYCLDLVRKFDYENFMAVLLLKNQRRSTALAVRSFNVEVARIAEQTTQNSTRQARLQFWNDTVEKCFSKDIQKVPQHPVAVELYKAVCRSNLTKRYFHNLIRGRYSHLNLTNFKNLEEMEVYAEETVSNVYYLILEGCGVKNIHADHVASHLGKAQGIVNSLRSIVLARQLNFIPVPQEILVKYSISEEEILKGRSSSKLGDCTYEIASRAYQHLSKARNLLDKLPRDCIPVFISAVTVDGFLQKLQVEQYDIFSPSLKRKPLFWLPKMMWYNLRNKY